MVPWQKRKQEIVAEQEQPREEVKMNLLKCKQQAQLMSQLKTLQCSMGFLSFHQTKYHHMPESQRQALQLELPQLTSTYIQQTHPIKSIMI